MKINNRDKKNPTTFKMILSAGEIGLSTESGSLFIEGNHIILVDSSLCFLSFLDSGYARLCMAYKREGTFICVLK